MSKNEGDVVVQIDGRRHQHKRSLSRKFINFLRNDLVGVATNDEKKKSDVPEGYKLCHTRTGQPYLRKIGRKKRKRVGTDMPILSDLKLIQKKFGEGIYQYFYFLKFLCIINLILSILGLINSISHWSMDPWISTAQGVNNTDCTDLNLDLNVSEIIAVQISNFYISSYGPKSYKVWWWTNAIAIVLSLFIFPTTLSSNIRKRFRRLGQYDTQDRYKRDDDIIRKKGKILNPKGTKYGRIFFSYFIFLFLNFVFGIIILGFVVAQLYVFNKSLQSSILVGFVTLAVDFGGQFIWTALTKFEKHYRWTTFNKHHTAKYYISKISSFSLMLLSYYLVRNEKITGLPLWNWITKYADPDPNKINCISSYNPASCEIPALGNTFISFMLIGLTIGNIAEIVYPIVYRKIASCFTKKKISKYNDVARPEFEVADEYLELFIRQYIIYIGMTFVPILPILGLISNLLEILVDRYRLMRLTKTPPYLRGSMRHFLVFFMFITSLISLLMYPYGTFLTLGSFILSESCPETILANPKIL